MKNNGMKIKHSQVAGRVGGDVLYDAGGEAWIFRDPALGRDVAV
jgi:hypothetical protein